MYKPNFLLLIFLIASCEQKGQAVRRQPTVVDTLDHQNVYEIVEKMPHFRGGYELLMPYIQNNLVQPANDDWNGAIYFSFVVDTTGKIRNPAVYKKSPNQNSLKDLHEFENEGLRIITTMPDWIPGMDNGKKVCVKCFAPVKFGIKTKHAVKNIDSTTKF